MLVGMNPNLFDIMNDCTKLRSVNNAKFCRISCEVAKNPNNKARMNLKNVQCNRKIDNPITIKIKLLRIF